MTNDQEVKQTAERDTAEATSQEVPEQTSSESSEESQTPESSQPEVSEETPEADEKLSERGQKRMEQLARDRNEAVAKAKGLREGLEESDEDSGQPQQQMPPWMQQQARDALSDLGDEVTPEQYRQHVTGTAQQIARMEVERFKQQQERVNNFDKDIDYLEKEYPELGGDEVEPKLLNAVKRAKQNYEIALRANPDARLKDFVEPLMEARTGGKEEGKGEAATKLSQQTNQQAVQPSTGASTERISTTEELEKMMKEGKITAEDAEEKYPDLLLGK